MKKLLSLLLALLMVCVLCACGGTPAPAEGEDKDKPAEGETASDLSYLKEKGDMIIGITLYEPMNYEDASGELTGFDTELAKLVSQKLGVEAKFQVINWDTKEVELNAKTIDCIWNGLTINDERKASMEMTSPYVKNAQVVLVKEGTEYTDTASLSDKTLVAEQGSAGEKTIAEDANLSKATFIPKSTQSDCLLEVKSATADAAVLDLTLANTMTGEGTNYTDLKIVDRLGEEFYGIAFRKGSDVAAEVNTIMEALKADGSLQTLAEKYGLDLA